MIDGDPSLEMLQEASPVTKVISKSHSDTGIVQPTAEIEKVTVNEKRAFLITCRRSLRGLGRFASVQKTPAEFQSLLQSKE